MGDYKTERNKVGVDDMVMLNEISEAALIANLEKRYKEKYIYTSIGSVLISMNPYTDLRLTTPELIKKYHEQDNFHIPPHIFTIANDAYRAMLSEGESQSIIISGESGAGKTEAAKGIMQYLAAVSGKGQGQNVEKVKNVILESNPLLESFGNAKTLRNNNSSRFGKYIEIQFDFGGAPEGGRVRNYLLEKSRVIQRTQNERSFHIFYQLFQADGGEKSAMKLDNAKPENFKYLSNSGCYTADGINDREWWTETRDAIKAVGITSGQQNDLMKLLAGILHMGNLTFKQNGKDSAVVEQSTLSTVAMLLGTNAKELERAFCYRTITSGSARASSVQTPQTVPQAEFARDAFSKNIFSRLFDWIVSVINTSIDIAKVGKNIGILDIYGFEIFEINSFEQLCINYCNETLHQIFIDLTLKMEQEEYVREGIKWEPIQYVNNKPCVELLAGKPMGVYAILDEECLLGQGTDKTFLDKLNRSFNGKEHFKPVTDRNLKDRRFAIMHYAGTVQYEIENFLEKNRDYLFGDLQQVALASSNSLLKEVFVMAQKTMYETDDGKAAPKAAPKAINFQGKGGPAQRPITAGAQFKKSMQTLLNTLYSCQPHYIRCIKPNDQKKALMVEPKRMREQVVYLGLLENLKVRRAGFCYRQTYEKWIRRYYMVSDKTFPRWKSSDREACELLMREVLGLPTNEFQLGKTKLFIKSPQALFDVEEKRFQAFNRIATKIQSVWRSYKIRKVYLEMKREAMNVYGGKKERSRMSMMRSTVSFYGDFLGLQSSIDYRELLAKNGDKEVIFSDLVKKINRKYKVQDRGLVLTNKAVYNLKPLPKPDKRGVRYVVQRRIPLEAVTAVSVSRLADNYLVLHVPTEYDYVYETPKKTVFIIMMNKYLKRNGGREKEVRIVESITYQIKKGQNKAISFSKDENAASAMATKSKGGLNVKIRSGENQ